MQNPQNILIFATLLGAFGFWLMLPRGGYQGRSIGVLLSVTALGTCASQLPYLGDWLSEGIFGILAGVTVVSAAASMTFRNPVYCALWFGMMLLGVAGLFLFDGAQFLAVATVVVYAGAILVTFLFVLMLAQPKGNAISDRVSWEPMLSAAAGIVMVGILSTTVAGVFTAPEDPGKAPLPIASQIQLEQGVHIPEHVAALGAELFGKHLIAIEVAGTLLLAAIVGAAVIISQGKTTNNQLSMTDNK
jgi:NADH-quinone oxidoreductase subunit J